MRPVAATLALVVLGLPGLASAFTARTNLVPEFIPAAVAVSPDATSPDVSVAADSPSPSQITIQRVSTGGSGCPRNSVSIDISPDRTYVTLGFDEFQTYTGRSRRREERDKMCRVTLGLRYPGGYSFAVLEATYHGFAQLDPGVTAEFESGYSFVDQNDRPLRGEFRNGRDANGRRRLAGEGESVVLRSTLSASGGDAASWRQGRVYTKTDKVDASRIVRSPCGQNVRLVIRTRLRLTNGGNETAEGMLTGDDATFALTQQVNIGWEKCTE